MTLHDALVAVSTTARYVERVCYRKTSYKTRQAAQGREVGREGCRLFAYLCLLWTMASQ
jgi:hypothetical protein